MTRQHVSIAVIAALLGLLILSGPGKSWARWSYGQEISPMSKVTGGVLSIAYANPTYQVTRTDFTPTATALTNTAVTTTDVTSNVAAYQFIPGDVITVTSDLTLTVNGQNLRADLTVDPSGFTATDLDLKTELAVAGNQTATLTPVGAAPALVSSGTNKYRVSTANNGATYRLTFSVKVRATTTGLARTANQPGNWWLTKLQGKSTTAKANVASLTQVP